jgi:hypothetical protein
VKSCYKEKKLFRKFLRLRCYGKDEGMQKQRTPRHIARVTMDRRWKRGRHHKRRRDEIEWDLNTMGIKETGQRPWGWRKVVLESKVRNGERGVGG